MIKLKLDITADEMELLRYLVFKGTEFTCFNARTFILWLNNRRNFRIKELLKLNFASRGSTQEIIYPKILKSLVNMAYTFGSSFIETSLKPFIYEKNKLEIESVKEFLRTGNIEAEPSDWVEFQLYMSNNNYLSLSDYADLKKAKFFIEMEKLLKCLNDNFKVLGLKDREFRQG